MSEKLTEEVQGLLNYLDAYYTGYGTLGEVALKEIKRRLTQQQKPRVSREWVKRWASFWNDDFFDHKSSNHTEAHVKEMLAEINVEVGDD